MAVHGVYFADGAAVDDFFDLLVVLAVTVLMAHDGLHARLAHELHDLERVGRAGRDRLFVRDQLRAGVDARLDQREAHVRQGAEAEHVGLHVFRECRGVFAGGRVAELLRGGAEARVVDVTEADHLEARIRVEGGGVVLAAFAEADHDHSVLGVAHDACLLQVGFTPLADLRDGVVDFVVLQFRIHGQ